MRISDEIRIIDLLAQRDAEYLKVKECENAISAILGEGVLFPYDAPPIPLPSADRMNAKRAWKPVGLSVAAEKTPAKSALSRKGTSAGATTAPNCNFPLSEIDDELRRKLRPLNSSEENAYRVTYRDNNEIKTSFHDDNDMLLAITTMRCSGFEVLTVESVWFVSPQEVTVCEKLWQSPHCVGM